MMSSAISDIRKPIVHPEKRLSIPLDPVQPQAQAFSVWLVLTNGRLLLSSRYARDALLVTSTLLIIVLLYLCPPKSDFRSMNLLGTQDHEVVNEAAAAVLHFQSGGSLSTTIGGVISVLDKVERENTVMMTVLTPKFDMFMQNWDCYAKPLIGRQFLVFTTDYEFGRRISEEGGYHVLVHGFNLTDTFSYGSLKYNEMLLLRTVLANELLEAGNSVFIFDNDAVWFSDPLPYLFNDSSADLVSTRDGAQLMDEVLCGGFLLLKQTPTTKRVWSEVTRLLAESIEASGHANEQLILNGIIQEEERNVTAVRDKGFEPLKIGFLDPLLFPNGRTYFVNKLPQKMGVQPVVVHNNWVVGTEQKLERFHKSGLWAVDDATVDNNNMGQRMHPEAGEPAHKCTKINRSPKKGRKH